jgi:hypothetical protein
MCQDSKHVVQYNYPEHNAIVSFYRFTTQHVHVSIAEDNWTGCVPPGAQGAFVCLANPRCGRIWVRSLCLHTTAQSGAASPLPALPGIVRWLVRGRPLWEITGGSIIWSFRASSTLRWLLKPSWVKSQHYMESEIIDTYCKSSRLCIKSVTCSRIWIPAIRGRIAACTLWSTSRAGTVCVRGGVVSWEALPRAFEAKADWMVLVGSLNSSAPSSQFLQMAGIDSTARAESWYHLGGGTKLIYIQPLIKNHTPWANQRDVERHILHVNPNAKVVPTGNTEVGRHTAITDIMSIWQDCDVMNDTCWLMFHHEEMAHCKTALCDQRRFAVNNVANHSNRPHNGHGSTTGLNAETSHTMAGKWYLHADSAEAPMMASSTMGFRLDTFREFSAVGVLHWKPGFQIE